MRRNDLLTEFHVLLPGSTTEAGPSRRTASKVALGAGNAASTLPTLAQSAIRLGRWSDRGGGHDRCEGLHDALVPRGAGRQDRLAGGAGAVRDLRCARVLADTARRFAKAGYLATAPELFVRQGDAQSYGEMARLIAEVISKVPDAQIMADLDAVMKWAAANGGDAAAKASKFVVYPDAPHAFHADYRASCRKEAADGGWKRALEWIKAQGVA